MKKLFKKPCKKPCKKLCKKSISDKLIFSGILLASTLLTACGGGGGSSSDDSDGSDDAEDNTTAVLTTTIDAATDATQAAKLDLSSGATVTDDNWHIAYQKYVGFSVNGGASGSGDVSGCIAHQYDALFDENGELVTSEFEALSADNTLDDFTAVTKDSCVDSEYVSDLVNTEILFEDWVDSSQYPALSALEGNGWIIKTATDENYARVKVKDLTVVSGVSREVTLTVEGWDAINLVFNDAVDSPVLDFSDDRVFYDIETNTVVTESDDWDLSLVLDGFSYSIQVNGGASGNGDAGVAYLLIDSVDDVTDPTVAGVEVYKYFADSAEGIMSEPGSYGALQYNVAGNHQMWPTYTTYIIKEGESYFKIQVLSNYGEDGIDPSATIYLRYEELVD